MISQKQIITYQLYDIMKQTITYKLYNIIKTNNRILTVRMNLIVTFYPIT